MAGLFIRWLEEFEHLEDAGFVTVAFVGIRLLVRVIDPTLVPPEWVMVLMIALVFTWGFSKRVEEDDAIAADAADKAIHTANGTVPTVAELEAQGDIPADVAPRQEDHPSALPVHQD